jgi:cytochrome c oxidase cbb3-type subunit I/II
MKNIGVPYAPEEVRQATSRASAQAKTIADELRGQGVAGSLDDKEIVALIAYLQSLKDRG